MCLHGRSAAICGVAAEAAKLQHGKVSQSAQLPASTHTQAGSAWARRGQRLRGGQHCRSREHCKTSTNPAECTHATAGTAQADSQAPITAPPHTPKPPPDPPQRAGWVCTCMCFALQAYPLRVALGVPSAAHHAQGIQPQTPPKLPGPPHLHMRACRGAPRTHRTPAG